MCDPHDSIGGRHLAVAILEIGIHRMISAASRPCHFQRPLNYTPDARPSAGILDSLYCSGQLARNHYGSVG